MSDLAKAVDEGANDKGPDKYEIELWAKTLLDAEEIRSDEKKMALVQPLLDKKGVALKKLTKGRPKSTQDIRDAMAAEDAPAC